MGRGYRAGIGDSWAPVTKVLQKQDRRLAGVERASGTSLSSLVQQVQTALANITTTVTNAINTLSYTKSEIDSRVANPPAGSAVTGNVSATGNVTATGGVSAGGTVAAGTDVTAAGNISTPGILTALASRTLVLASGYAGAWIDINGRLGISPSSRRYKSGIRTWQPDIVRLLEVRAVLYRMDPELFGTEPDTPLEVGLIAEELFDAGFPEFVFLDAENNVQGIHYDRLTAALLELHRWQDQRLTRIEQHLGLTSEPN
jgi:hypothetical protein